MKFTKLNSVLVSALFVPGYIVFAAPANAGAQSFSCTTVGRVPTTVANMSSGQQIPMIRWVSSVFDDSGWSPARRCNEVSARLTSLNNSDSLRYLTTGQMNGMNVICSSLKKNDRCSDLVYTLKPSQNPSQTLRKLFVVRTYAVGPLNETGDRVYIDVNEYLGLGQSDALPQKSTGDKLNAW